MGRSWVERPRKICERTVQHVLFVPNVESVTSQLLSAQRPQEIMTLSVAGRFRHPTSWSRIIWMLPFLGIILVISLDHSSSKPDVTFEPALTAGPALAAVVTNRTWYPVAVGAVSIGAAFGVAAYDRTLDQSVHSASVFAIILIT